VELPKTQVAQFVRIVRYVFVVDANIIEIIQLSQRDPNQVVNVFDAYFGLGKSNLHFRYAFPHGISDWHFKHRISNRHKNAFQICLG
jgi:hypothetical protein